MRWVRLGLLLCGTALFLGLLVHVGPGAVAQAFADLSWRLLIILVFPFGMTTLLDTLGWRFAFRRDRAPFTALLAARLAGEAFNLTTPTAAVGGEPVKAWLVRPWTPLSEGLPSVIVAKTTIVIGQALFLVIGLVAAHAALPSAPPAWAAVPDGCRSSAGFPPAPGRRSSRSTTSSPTSTAANPRG